MRLSRANGFLLLSALLLSLVLVGPLPVAAQGSNTVYLPLALREAVAGQEPASSKPSGQLIEEAEEAGRISHSPGLPGVRPLRRLPLLFPSPTAPSPRTASDGRTCPSRWAPLRSRPTWRPSCCRRRTPLARLPTVGAQEATFPAQAEGVRRGQVSAGAIGGGRSWPQRRASGVVPDAVRRRRRWAAGLALRPPGQRDRRRLPSLPWYDDRTSTSAATA